MGREEDVVRYNRIYHEGCIARRARKSNVDNPYVDDGDMEAWNEGWFDEADYEREVEEGLYDD